MQLAMAVAKGEGMGGHSFSTSKSVLGGNQCRTCHFLYNTLLGAPTEGCVQEEGVGCYLVCNHLPRQHGCVRFHAQRLGQMKRGPIYAWHGPSFLKGVSWHTIPPGMRQSGSPPVGSPMILAGWRREWRLHW